MADAIIAKAKAMYGRRLSADDYNNLLHKNSVGAIVGYLRDKNRYHMVFANVNELQVHRGQVEQLLQKNMFETYIKLCKFMAADKNSFCYYLIKEQEVKQLASVLMYIKSGNVGEYVKVFPAYLQDYLSFNLLEIAKSTTPDDLLRTLEQTQYYKILRPLIAGKNAEDIDLERCSIELYSYYIKWALKAIERNYSGETAKELKALFQRKADQDNILTCYRLKTFFNADTETVEKSLRPYHYRVSPKRLHTIISSSNATVQLSELLKKSYFKKIPYDSANPEVAMRRYDYDFYKNQLMMTENGTMALYSVMVLFEVERSNIQKIIEGIRYGLETSEIEKLLVM